MRVQTDLLEAIAGDLAQVEGEEPEVVGNERADRFLSMAQCPRRKPSIG